MQGDTLPGVGYTQRIMGIPVLQQLLKEQQVSQWQHRVQFTEHRLRRALVCPAGGDAAQAESAREAESRDDGVHVGQLDGRSACADRELEEYL